MTQNPRHSRTWYKLKIHVSPLSIQKAHVLAKYAKFAESAPMTSKLGVNPENSRNVQQTTQVLCLSHNASANHVKLATFANKTQDKLPFLTHFAHVSLHIFRIYAHILHHCRLVLSTYKFYC